MRVLLTGRNGQVGWELERALAPLGEVIATDRSTLNLADPDMIRRVVREAKPEVIVNAAAYTAVDKAESEAELAMKINGLAPGVLAEESKRLGARVVHYSTDYVFDGEKATPYVEDDEPNPINEYGRSKLAGERAVETTGCRHLILRTSWVYGGRGRNFLLTILKAARERPELRVVSDQTGAPTSSRSIARATAEILRISSDLDVPAGIYHMTAKGQATWYAFALAILAEFGLRTPIVPISSEQSPTTACRPRNSLLDNSKLAATFNIRLPSWQEQLSDLVMRTRGD